MALACSDLKQSFGFWPEIEAGSWCWGHQILTTRTVISDTALTHWLWRKEFSQRQKAVKQVNCLLRGKRSIVRVSKHRAGLREGAAELHPRGIWISWDISPGFLWSVIWFAWFWICIWCMSGSSLCSFASLSQQMDSQQWRGLWVGWHHLLWGDAHSVFDPQRAFLHVYSWGGLLNFSDEEYVVFHFLSEQGSDSSIFLLLWSFCHREETAQPGVHLSPALGTQL